MSDELKLARAKNAYQIICGALDDNNWKYEADEEKLVTRFTVNGDDLPMDMVLFADMERQQLRLFSSMPYKVPEDKIVEAAVVICAANYQLADGIFEFDVSKGNITFRINAIYSDSRISKDLVHYLLAYACATVDEFNDQFLAVIKGIMTVDTFMEKIK